MTASMNISEFWADISQNANASWLFWIAFAFFANRDIGWFVVLLFVLVHLA